MRGCCLKSWRFVRFVRFVCAVLACACLLTQPREFMVSAASTDVVLYASDVTSIQGNWSQVSGSNAAGGQYMASVDRGWSTLDGALASPRDYFESSFSAAASTPYHVWLRLRADANSKWNDSVWVQFSDSTDQNGSAIYRIGTTSALMVNLENCSGCGDGGWGWQDGAYWLSQLNMVRFASGGSHTIRIQTREDGVQLDQIVLSPSTYLSSSPGQNSGDLTIVQQLVSAASSSSSSSSSASASASTSSSSSGGLSPFHGTPVSLPGTVQAEDFDNGGEGIAYHDADRGNNGGAYRQTDVDIEAASSGGYDVGWTSGGEWLNYTVNVPSAGSYVAQLRVASPGGGNSLHLGFNTASNVWKVISIPATGGWQNWTTVSVPVTLGAGIQQITVLFDTGGINLDSITVTADSGSTVLSSAPAPPPPGGGSGTVLPVIEWNIQIDNSSDGHARQAMDMLLATGPQPQVIVIVEAYSTLFNTYIDELQRQTGKTWYGAFATHCNKGSWNGSGCANWYQGIGIFSTYQITSQSSTLFPYWDCWTDARAGLRAAINVNGTPVQVFATHLQTGGCTNDAQSRYNSMRDLKNWASQFSTPQIVAGDFNADPDQIDTTSGMLPNFLDSWFPIGTGSRFTAFSPNPSMKIDYWFSDTSGRALPVQSSVINGPQSVSDHFPIQASFLIR